MALGAMLYSIRFSQMLFPTLTAHSIAVLLPEDYVFLAKYDAEQNSI